jgi:hypothetical protein
MSLRLCIWHEECSSHGGRYEVDRDYDIFEKLPDGSSVWREMVVGRENARLKVQSLAKLSSNEFFAIHTPTKDIIARENITGQ